VPGKAISLKLLIQGCKGPTPSVAVSDSRTDSEDPEDRHDGKGYEVEEGFGGQPCVVGHSGRIA
jgi:hypothetical protein